MSELTQLSGVGEQRAKLIKEAGIRSLRDLVYHLPRRYIDKTRFEPLSRLRPDQPANFTACVESVDRWKKGNRERLVVTVGDGTGRLELVYFNGVSFWHKRFRVGQRVQVYGVPAYFQLLQIVHPELVFLKEEEEPVGSVSPVYPLTEAMQQGRVEHKFIRNIVMEALKKYSFKDPLPSSLRAVWGLRDEGELLYGLHAPAQIAGIEGLRRQLKIRELVPVCLRLEMSKKERSHKGRPHTGTGKLSKKLTGSLPFQLTEGQKYALAALKDGLAAPRQFFGLLQGDVGSGKTLAALLAALQVLEAKSQVAVMVPTEILAIQQHQVLQTFLKSTGMICVLLLGSTPQEERKVILAGLKSGDISLIVGTHVLFSNDVAFKELGLIVIDEQHRYGVQQREALSAKGSAPDVLHMTATPIPRTLTHTLYGDMENIELKGLPPGRKPVNTRLVGPGKRQDMNRFLLNEVTRNNNQIYWVVPRISDKPEGPSSQKSQEDLLKAELQSMQALCRGLQAFSRIWRVGMVHGRLATDQKENILHRFMSKKIDVLVSTTVIEVGIDVPSANLMIIENPDRFGLAQLHQLRGRVGRGGLQGWCFLALPEVPYPDRTMEKLRRFCETADGFKIAELDLEFRGTGDVEGQQQSGFGNLRFTDLIRDFRLVREVRSRCVGILTGEYKIARKDILAVTRKH